MAQTEDFAAAAAARQQGLGERASIELQLQDAKRDLQELVEERSELFRQSDVHFALAADPGQNRVQCNLQATDKRLKAFLLSGRIGTLELKVKNLDSRLKGEPAQAAPVVLCRDAVEGMDDMAGVL